MNLHAWLLVGVTLVWGTTFPVLKQVSADLSGLEVSVLRFWVAACCVLPFVWRASGAAWRAGAWLGGVALLSYVTQAYGLHFISSNRSAFLTSLNVLLVPLLGSLLGARPSMQVWAAAVLALLGIGLMSWEGGAHMLGDAATLLCALSYAGYVLLLARFAGQYPARVLAGTQIVMMAVFGTLVLPLEGAGALADLPARAYAQAPAILYLGCVATAGMLFLQAVGQKRVGASQAALIYALEPVFAALFAWWWLAERIGMRAVLGGILVVGGVLLAEWRCASPTQRTSA